MTTTTGDPGAWHALGTRLKQRRAVLGYRSRQAFCDITNLDYRLIYDIEEARRVNFGDTTLTAIEVGYRLRPGSIAAFLSGGELAEAEPEWRPQPGMGFTDAEIDAAHPRYDELRERYDSLCMDGILDPSADDMFPLRDSDVAEAGLAAAWETAAARVVARDEARRISQTIWAVALYQVRREARMHGEGNADSSLTAATPLPMQADLPDFYRAQEQ
jgi:hypothetical protein